MGKREPLDDGDDCPGCERAPPTGYYLCPVCDAEYPDEEPHPMIWQPIETAPRDGTRVLLYEDGHYYAGETEGDDGYWASYCGQYVVTTPDPTHWMPLPEAPTHD